jgi:ATP-binding cassette subfamily B protein
MGMMRAGLTAEAYDRGYTNRELFRRIAAYFRPQSRRLLIVMTLVSLLSLSGALLPVLMAQGVNVVTSAAANRDAR